MAIWGIQMKPYHVFVKLPDLGWRAAMYFPKEDAYYLCGDEFAHNADEFEDVVKMDMPGDDQ